MTQHTIYGGGGLALAVEEWGDPDGQPILFIHGYSQSRLCWLNQTESSLVTGFRMLALDLRGHGDSEKPADAAAYSDPQLWADDINAVITGLALYKPVLVGSSYAGYVICDYIRAYGQERIGGINWVGAATLMGGRRAAGYLGKDFVAVIPATYATDAVGSVAALSRFIRLLTFQPLVAAEFYLTLGFNVAVPPHVRQALFSRRIENEDLLPHISVPCLFTHGEADAVVAVAASQYHAGLVPGAHTSYYAETGHAPFIENPARFNQELADFARSCRDL